MAQPVKPIQPVQFAQPIKMSNKLQMETIKNILQSGDQEQGNQRKVRSGAEAAADVLKKLKKAYKALTKLVVYMRNSQA